MAANSGETNERNSELPGSLDGTGAEGSAQLRWAFWGPTQCERDSTESRACWVNRAAMKSDEKDACCCEVCS